MKISINQVEDITVDGVDRGDYPDLCDAFADHAIWKATGEELTNEELDDLQEQHPDEIHEIALETMR